MISNLWTRKSGRSQQTLILFYFEGLAAIQTFLFLATEDCLINTGLHVRLIYSRQISAGGVVY